MKSRQPLRTRQISAIHVCKNRLGLDDDTYRALLQREGGENSSAKLSATGRARVLAAFQRLGATASQMMRNAVPTLGPAPNVQADNEAMIGKIGAILADSGREWAYAQGVARRMFRRERLEWLRHDELHKLVAALQIDANRRKARGT
jgi:phage gp16-like protein